MLNFSDPTKIFVQILNVRPWFPCNKFHLGLNSTRKLVWTDFMLDDFLPPTNLWNKLSLFLFITWGGRKTNDKWQKYLVWYDHHKLIATRIYFIWLCFASLNWYHTKVYTFVSPSTINFCKLIQNLLYWNT